MEINIKEIFIMDFYMEMELSYGRMALNIKVNLLTIELQEKEFIHGLMEVYMKDKSKMD